MTAEKILASYAAHNSALARIADEKFKAIRHAVWSLYVALPGAFAYAMLYAFAKMAAEKGVS